VRLSAFVRATIFGLAGLLVLTACISQAAELEPEPEPEPEPVVIERPEPVPVVQPIEELTDEAPLTGVLIDSERAAQLAEQPLLLVKVDNGPTARPQAGLEVADIVFEELVEGGVTRFVAAFHSELPERVGPVRSARFVDVDLGSGFGRPVFANSGARPDAVSRLAAVDWPDASARGWPIEEDGGEKECEARDREPGAQQMPIPPCGAQVGPVRRERAGGDPLHGA
jgi:hypothetical protein